MANLAFDQLYLMKKLIVLAFFTLLSCSTNTPEESIVTPVTYILTVSASKGGTIDNTGGIQNENVDVIITAIPAEGYIFSEWSGSADGTINPLAVSMTTDKSITANFTRIQYTLNLFKVGEGAISQEVISAARTTEDYNAGTSVRLNATPSSGWIFTSWSGSSTSTANPIDLIIDETKTITATFVECTTVTKFSVTGNLPDPTDPTVKVKSLSPDCSSGGLDGRIGVVLSGGLLPKKISWFVQDTLSPSTAANPTYRALPETENRTSLDNLLPGSYKMVVASIDSNLTVCENGSIYYEEIIEVVGQKPFYIIDGPFVDENFCLASFGNVIIDVFDSIDGNLSFYYNSILIPSSDVNRLDNDKWSVAILNTIESADLRIVNEAGCGVTVTIDCSP
jgi:hypothetical protein